MRSVSRTSAFITAKCTEGPTRPYTQLTNTDYFLQSAATVLWKLPQLMGQQTTPLVESGECNQQSKHGHSLHGDEGKITQPLL